MRTFYIYKYTNKINGKFYIGQCTNPEQRKIAHKSRAEKNDGGCPLFYRAIRKYGFDQFEFEILEILNDQKSADQAERKWIKNLNSTDPKIGYNIVAGGGGRANPLNTDTHKFCSGCKLVKVRTEFGKNNSTHDGIEHLCSACFNLKQRNKRASLSEDEKLKINIERREKYKENPQPAIDSAKKYYNANPEKTKLRKQKYREENKDAISKHLKEYRENNKEKMNENDQKLREKYKEQNSLLTNEEIFARTPFKLCRVCNVEHPSVEFYIDKTRLDGLGNLCKTKHKEQMAINRETKRQQQEKKI